jgi:hypothetical protein
MIEWKSLHKSELRQIIASWTNIEMVKWDAPPEFEPVRQRLLDLFNTVKSDLGIDTVEGKEYQFDLRFGIGLYTLLKREFNLTESKASNDSMWIYLGIKVIPDIVFWRWKRNSLEERFYANSRRIWLKTLWWYIHLSWQGDEQKTMKILEGNTTDEIVQLVERSGPFGYRVQLCRVLMRKYGELELELRGRGTKLFRRAMKLNTARLSVIEPALYEGEEEGYVKELFNDLIGNQ